MIRHRSVRTLALLVAGVATVGCRTSSEEPRPSPLARASTCQAAFPGREVVEFATTIGVIRARSAGPVLHPAEHAWPDRRDGEPAAWCYVRSGRSYTVAGAVRDEPPVVFANGGFTPSPRGPQIP